MNPLPINVKVTVTYQSKPLTARYYDEHPEIHQLYPSPEVFISKIYRPLVDKARETNTLQVVEISENLVIINGIVQEIY